MNKYSEYIIYVDESGDHNLKRTDPDYPVFVIAFCIIKKSDYYKTISPAIQKLKFDFFGNDIVILHENEIRKEKGSFVILRDSMVRNAFMQRIEGLVKNAPFSLIATVVNKATLTDHYSDPANPYKIAMAFCMERAYMFLKELNQDSKITHIVVEARGQKEDKDLELEFRRIVQGRNFHKIKYPFELIITDKKVNSGGLQLADLLARPIGLNVLRPEQENRAFKTIESKFRTGPTGKIKGFGLKTFP